MERLNISQMKELSTGHFFSASTMRFFRGSRNKAFYDPKTGKNYIRVTHEGREVWYEFREDGTVKYLNESPFIEKKA